MGNTTTEARYSFFLDKSRLPPQKNDTSAYFPATRQWQAGIFFTKGRSAPYYIAQARRESALVVGCSGLNTHYLLEPDQVKRLNDNGISLVWMALPKPVDGQPIIDAYKEILRDFLTSDRSPARLLIRGHAPAFLLTHSTGGQLFFHLLNDPLTERKLRREFAGAIHVTPYLDTAHVSRDHANRFIRWIYESYMAHDPDKTPNGRFVSRGYMLGNQYLEALAHCINAARDEGTADGDSSRISPPLKLRHIKSVYERFEWPERLENAHPGMNSTCGQILELQRRGRDLTATFNASACKIPSWFVLGDRDNFACPKSAADFGRKIGAEIIIARGGFHDPLKTHPHLFDEFVDRIKTCAMAHEQRRANRTIVPPPSATLDEDLSQSFSGGGARLAFQGGARFLDAATGLLQRPFRRGVGNPEMRR